MDGWIDGRMIDGRTEPLIRHGVGSIPLSCPGSGLSEKTETGYDRTGVSSRSDRAGQFR